MRLSVALPAALASLLVLALGAFAEEPPFVGTWSLDPAFCSAGQETADAPLVIGADRYDQHESHCSFKSVAAAGSDWRVKSECTVEGSPLDYDFTLTVSGNTLTFTDSGGARDFLRCK